MSFLRVTRYTVINGTFLALLYLGLVKDVQGAMNVALVLAWLSFALSLLVFDANFRASLKLHGRSVPKVIDVSFDFFVFGLLIWHGWIVTGLAYLLHLTLQEYAMNAEIKLK